MKAAQPENIDAYINSFPTPVQKAMKTLRSLVHSLVPEVEEGISYNMPTFYVAGKAFLHFAAFKAHIGLYSLPTDHEDFIEDFKPYKTGRGSMQLPLDKEVPIDLVTRIVRHKLNLS